MKPESGEHEFQATNVTGIKGGKIMCEMRNAQTRSDGPRSGRDRRRREPRTTTTEEAAPIDAESSVQETPATTEA